MELRDIENRLEEIRSLNIDELEAEDVQKYTAEVNELNEQRQKLIDEREQQAAAALKAVNITEERDAEVMENVITRNSPEYINAYAEAIKKDDFTEVRSLLTENASGTVAVPDVVANIVKTAWERNEIWNRVPKSYLKGNYKIQFEISGELAVYHEEGDDPIDEEELVLGIVELQPVYLKKYVMISDEAMSLTGEAFLNYIYDEITYRIISAAVSALLGGIANAPTTPTSSSPAVAVLSGNASIDDIINAEGQLEGDLSDVVVITSRSAYATYRALAITAGYPFDVFDGLPVLFTDQLPSGVRAIVGSLADGVHFNLPNGSAIDFKIDDRSIAVTSKDMVAVLGRLFIGMGVVRNKAFCVIADE